MKKVPIWEICGIANILDNGGNKVHFQFLIEDQSSAVLMEILMKKIMLSNPNITYDCKSFKGIGGFTKKNTTI